MSLNCLLCYMGYRKFYKVKYKLVNNLCIKEVGKYFLIRGLWKIAFFPFEINVKSKVGNVLMNLEK